MFDRSKRGENALLVQPQIPGHLDPAALEEFGELARSAGANVVGRILARVDKPSPRFYLGSGKVEEIKVEIAGSGADLVIVNAHLSPVQERNLEKALECRVVDRAGLILDIFAQRARSYEGKLQVELAQLKHMATRLVRGWTHLERQRGGIGNRGPGETQLETDRRLLANRVKLLTRQLARVETQREQGRRARVRGEVPRVALVGYTNAGKSTLFNALTGADAYAENLLFATLDPTVRRLPGLRCGEVVLADTVGFVRDLPHELIAAFKSTLAEAREADLLLHVIDAADPERALRIGQVREVLHEIGAGTVPELEVFNKIDLLDEPARSERDDAGVRRVWLSAHSGAGLDLLREALEERFAEVRVQARLRLPGSAARLRSKLYAGSAVLSEQIDEDGHWLLDLDLPRARARQIAAGPDGHWLEPLLESGNGSERDDEAPEGATPADRG